MRFSTLVAEQPWIKEIDVNPLLASPERLVALDARVVLHPVATVDSALPRTAIRATRISMSPHGGSSPARR